MVVYISDIINNLFRYTKANVYIDLDTGEVNHENEATIAYSGKDKSRYLLVPYLNRAEFLAEFLEQMGERADEVEAKKKLEAIIDGHDMSIIDEEHAEIHGQFLSCLEEYMDVEDEYTAFEEEKLRKYGIEFCEEHQLPYEMECSQEIRRKRAEETVASAYSAKAWERARLIAEDMFMNADYFPM